MTRPNSFHSKSVLLLRLLQSLCVIWLACCSASALAQPVRFVHDETQVSRIEVGGINLLTGGGIYLIGSATGADDPDTNHSTVGASGGCMTNNGPNFTLSFRQKNANTLGFRVDVGVLPRDMSEIGVAFDFNQQLMQRFRFDGNRFRWRCTGQDGERSGSGMAFDDLPQGCRIPPDLSKPVIGYVGAAVVDGAVPWAEVSGFMATVRVCFLRWSDFRSVTFVNHFATHSFGPDFGSLKKGQSAFVEGEIVVTPRRLTPQWVYQSETEFGHFLGKREPDGWSVAAADTPNKYLSFGPYSEIIFPGKRTATFRLMQTEASVASADNSDVLTLDVYDALSGKVLAARKIIGRDVRRRGVYQNFEVKFVAPAKSRLEFRTFRHGGCGIKQDCVTIR